VFGTSHTVDLAALAAAMGLAYLRLDDLSDLPRSLEPARAIRLVEIRASRAALRAGHAAVRAAVAAAL
jgi:2-succinyl-5-enolpyruvyl-6-hydroxy-3-cyclohexene-1-carboxylate synthase